MPTALKDLRRPSLAVTASQLFHPLRRLNTLDQPGQIFRQIVKPFGLRALPQQALLELEFEWQAVGDVKTRLRQSRVDSVTAADADQIRQTIGLLLNLR